jgi:hypothetical protein
MNPQMSPSSHSASTRSYHTTECRVFQQIDSPRPASENEIEHFEECGWCCRNGSRSGGGAE